MNTSTTTAAVSRIDEIKERVSQVQSDAFGYHQSGYCGEAVYRVSASFTDGGGMTEANAKFISMTPVDVRWLLTEHERLTRELAERTRERDEARAAQDVVWGASSHERIHVPTGTKWVPHNVRARMTNGAHEWRTHLCFKSSGLLLYVGRHNGETDWWWSGVGKTEPAHGTAPTEGAAMASALSAAGWKPAAANATPTKGAKS